MWISIIWQWVIFLPLAYLAGPVMGFGLLGVWILNGFYRAGQAIEFSQSWYRGDTYDFVAELSLGE